MAKVRRGPVVTVQPLAPDELVPLPGGDLLDDRARDAQSIYDIAVQDPDAAGGDRAHGELLMPGHTELANDKDVERSVQRAGDFQRYRDSATRQSEHLDVGAVGIPKELARKQPAGLRSIVKRNCHHQTSCRGAVADDFLTRF